MSRILFSFSFSCLRPSALFFALALAIAPLHAQDADPADTTDSPDADAADAAETAEDGVELWDTRSTVPWSTTLGIGFNSHYFGSSINLLAPLSLSQDGNHFTFLDLQASAYDEGNP